MLLLSATPVNNQLSDLRNQISFIAGADVARNTEADAAFTETLSIASVKETMQEAQTHFTNWAKRPPEQRKTRELIAAIGGDFFKLLDGLSIARSRRQIASYYASEMKQLGGFPKRPRPKRYTPPLILNRVFSPLNNWTLRSAPCAWRSIIRPVFSAMTFPKKSAPPIQDKILGSFTQEGREDPCRHDEGQSAQTPRKFRGLLPADDEADRRQNQPA